MYYLSSFTSYLLRGAVTLLLPFLRAWITFGDFLVSSVTVWFSIICSTATEAR